MSIREILKKNEEIVVWIWACREFDKYDRSRWETAVSRAWLNWYHGKWQ